MESLIKTKRIIYIVAGVLILGGLAYYFFSGSTPTSTTPAGNGGTNTAVSRVTGTATSNNAPSNSSSATITPAETQALQGKLFQITSFPVISVSLNKEENKILYYKKDGGDLLASDFDGKNQEKISHVTIVGVFKALWSPLRDRAAVFYMDQSGVKSFIQIASSSIAVLPQDINSFRWSADGKSVAFFTPRGGGLDLVTADAAGRNQRVVFSTPVVDMQIGWVAGDKVKLQTAPSGLAPGNMFSLSTTRGLLSKVKSDLNGLDSLWSPDGTRVLLSNTDTEGKNLSLKITDANGQDIFTANLPTIPQKCLWASLKEIYCALPVEVPPEMIWPDDYLQGRINTKDQIVLINLDSKVVYGVLAQPIFDISDMTINKDQSYLFFINRADGNLWSLKLK